MTEVANKKISHEQLPSEILFNRRGLKHCLSRKYPPYNRERLLLLPEAPLLSKSVYDRKEADKHAENRPGVFVHVFYCSHVINEIECNIWLSVRETPAGLFFYDVGIRL